MNGRLGAWELFKSIPQSVYACQTDEFATLTINVVNRNYIPAKIRIAVTDVAHTALNVDYIEYDVELAGKGHLERTGIIVPENKFLTVESDSDNVNCVLWGIEVGAPDPTPPVLDRNIIANASLDFVAGEAVTLDTFAKPTGTTFAVTSGTLPNGLSLDSSTGVLSGTPVTSSYNIGGVQTTAEITATNSTEVFNIATTLTFNKRWLDGQSEANAAPSAQWIKNTTGINTDGVFWIDIPNVGPRQIYCLMNDAAAGGGWMMAMKGTRGNNFVYDSPYWTGVNLLNENQTNRNDGDAKYDTFNYFPATRIAAVFPDVSAGGEMGGAQGGWTWNQPLPVVQSTTLREFFARNEMYTIYGGGNGAVSNQTAHSGGPFSAQSGWQQWAFNYQTNITNKSRWGFGWNNESEQASNDVEGGIGLLKHLLYSNRPAKSTLT
jgi:hypothetical protein